MPAIPQVTKTGDRTVRMLVVVTENPGIWLFKMRYFVASLVLLLFAAPMTFGSRKVEEGSVPCAGWSDCI